MTNAESYLATATDRNNNDELNSWESDFVSQFEGWTKKQLRGLSSKQFLKLRDIANG